MRFTVEIEERKSQKFLALVEFSLGRIWADSSVNGLHTPTSIHPPTLPLYSVHAYTNIKEKPNVIVIIVVMMYFKKNMVLFSLLRGKRKLRSVDVTFSSFFHLFNRLKSREMTWCCPRRTGGGRYHWERWRECRGRVHAQSFSKRTHRALASLCGISLSTLPSPPFTSSRSVDCSVVVVSLQCVLFKSNGSKQKLK